MGRISIKIIVCRNTEGFKLSNWVEFLREIPIQMNWVELLNNSNSTKFFKIDSRNSLKIKSGQIVKALM